jgi:NAD(P)-dependent dehydrogenase (short-subunit alcohol dehydrogenase family)
MTRSVLITGTSSGIGRKSALSLAASGWRVFAGVRKAADGKSLMREAEGEIIPLTLDVARQDSVSGGIERLASETGGELHGLVNNAGVYLPGPLELVSPAEIEQSIAVNLTGLLLVTRACMPLLRAARGRIVNISSISGLIALPGVSVYAATKHAVEAITRSLRVELMPFGIKVIAIEPGAVETPLWAKGAARDAKLAQDPEGQEIRELYAPLMKLLQKLNAQPVGVTPETVARTVARALESSRPKDHYLIGKDARMLALLERLPAALRDRAIARVIGR